MDSMGQTEQERHVTLSESGAYDILYCTLYSHTWYYWSCTVFSLSKGRPEKTGQTDLRREEDSHQVSQPIQYFFFFHDIFYLTPSVQLK